MTQSFAVRDGSRLVTFDGELLGMSSSQRNSSPRWSEYRLYKTTTGVYVLEKVGRSVVVHMPGCPDIVNPLNRFEQEHPGKDPTDGWWFCESCINDYSGPAGYDITALLVENDRHWVIISEEPEQIMDALYRRKGGARSLPRLSLDLLETVARVDQAIADVYRIERIG